MSLNFYLAYIKLSSHVRHFSFSVFICVLLTSHTTQAGIVPGFRPPAVPLITYDPYFSIWSPADHLYDTWPVYVAISLHNTQQSLILNYNLYNAIMWSPYGGLQNY